MRKFKLPAPHPIRHILLRYLRHEYPVGEDLKLSEHEVYAYTFVKQVINSLKDCDPDKLQVLTYYITTTLPRTQIADAMDMDSSTVKRLLNKTLDVVLNRLRHSEFIPEDLFNVYDPYTNTSEVRKYPKVWFLNR